MLAKKFFNFTTLALLIFLLAGCGISKKTNQPVINNNQAQTGAELNLELEASYQKDLVAALQPYWTSHRADDIKTKILDLRAPAKFLDLHLNLVLAFEQLESGDQAKVAIAVERIDELKTQYPWLAVGQ